jgi:hypothetical protein
MEVTIDILDNLPLTEANIRIETIAIVLYQQHSLRLDKTVSVELVVTTHR